MRSQRGLTTAARDRARAGSHAAVRTGHGRWSVRPLLRSRQARTAGVLVMALLVTGVVASGDQDKASATAIAADFNPGNIISDTVFFNPATMADDQIQAFLSARGVNCVAGQQPCLKDYRATTVAEPSDGLCTGYAGGLVQTAAQIIGGVARACGINPQALIVLLEKEEGLVTRTKPATVHYTSATGYGCPDSSPACDSAYSGFFYQVYGAAHQFQKYAAHPGNYPWMVAGQPNSIHYNPNYACGSKNVYVANQATAGLYIYTPYVPNAAAMSNLYGLGDACSSYGNRNFWRLFTDWFGNPLVGSSLLRSPQNATVYLVSGTRKYPIGDMATVGSLSPLGQVGFVSQQYLDERTTGPMMSRVVLAPSGTVYFIDSGIKLPFASCAQVADFGASCGSLVQLDQPQIDALHNGPWMSSVYHTTSGKTFYITGSTKREIADDAAATAAGIPSGGVWLQESGIGYLPYGTPVTRDGIVVQDRQTGGLLVSAGGTFTPVPTALRAATPLSALPVRSLDDPGVRMLPAGTAVTGPFVQQTGGSTVYLLTEKGKVQVTGTGIAPATPSPAAAAVLALVPDAGSLDAATFLKGAADGTVYVLDHGTRRAVLSWTDLVNLDGGNATPAILQIDQRLADLLPQRAPQLGPGTMVTAPRSATVYFVDGKSSLVPLGSFAAPAEIGSKVLSRVANSTVDAYTVSSGGLGTALDCAGTRYLGLGGKLYRVGTDVSGAYALSYTSLDPLTCGALPKAAIPLSRFLRGDDGTIYYVDAGTKRPIRSYGTYLTLGGTGANTIQASAYGLAQIPTGALY